MVRKSARQPRSTQIPLVVVAPGLALDAGGTAALVGKLDTTAGVRRAVIALAVIRRAGNRHALKEGVRSRPETLVRRSPDGNLPGSRDPPRCPGCRSPRFGPGCTGSHCAGLPAAHHGWCLPGSNFAYRHWTSRSPFRTRRRRAARSAATQIEVRPAARGQPRSLVGHNPRSVPGCKASRYAG